MLRLGRSIPILSLSLVVGVTILWLNNTFSWRRSPLDNRVPSEPQETSIQRHVQRNPANTLHPESSDIVERASHPVIDATPTESPTAKPTLLGQVIDTERRPLCGVTVAVHAHDTSDAATSWSTTGDDGRFRITSQYPAKTLFVSLLCHGLAQQRMTVTPSAQATDLGVIVLNGGAIATGVVLVGGAAPSAIVRILACPTGVEKNLLAPPILERRDPRFRSGLSIPLDPSRSVIETSTDVKGQFKILGMQPGLPYDLQAWSPAEIADTPIGSLTAVTGPQQGLVIVAECAVVTVQCEGNGFTEDDWAAVRAFRDVRNAIGSGASPLRLDSEHKSTFIARTGSQGSTYVVVARGPGGTRIRSEELVLNPGEKRFVRLVLVKTGSTGSLVLSLQDQLQRCVEDCAFVLKRVPKDIQYKEADPRQVQGESGNGQHTLAGLAVGMYDIYAIPQSEALATLRFRAVVEPDKRQLLQLSIADSGSIRLDCVDGIRGIIEITDSEGDNIPLRSSGMNYRNTRVAFSANITRGSHVFVGITPGRYEVVLRADGKQEKREAHVSRNAQSVIEFSGSTTR